MTIQERYNLQKGRSKAEGSRYNSNSAFDNYVLARVKNRRLLMKEADFEHFVTAAGKDIAAAAEKELDLLLKNFK